MFKHAISNRKRDGAEQHPQGATCLSLATQELAGSNRKPMPLSSFG